MPPTFEEMALPQLLEVPKLNGSQTPGDAILALVRMRRSALTVSDQEKNYYLALAVDLYRARSNQVSSLRDLIAASPELEKLTTLDLGYNPAPDSIIQEFVARKLSLAVVPGPKQSGSGMLVMTSQTLYEQIRSEPAECYCTGARRHRFPPPSVRSGDLCPLDGYPIYCKI